MTVTNLRAIALRKHAEALFVARFCYDRAKAMKELERAAAARFVYANAEAINGTR
jgi:hypothetical protein